MVKICLQLTPDSDLIKEPLNTDI
jgi:hypothetical protein